MGKQPIPAVAAAFFFLFFGLVVALALPVLEPTNHHSWFPRTQGHASWHHLHDNVTGKATATPPLILWHASVICPIQSNLPLHYFVIYLNFLLFNLMLDKTMMMPSSMLYITTGPGKGQKPKKKTTTQSAHGVMDQLHVVL
jgi:hypothetical protein